MRNGPRRPAPRHAPGPGVPGQLIDVPPQGSRTRSVWALAIGVALASVACGGGSAPPLAPERAAERAAIEGEQCGGERPCEDPLVCARAGSCQAAGTSGTLPEGAGCASDSDCLRALVCGSEGACVHAAGGAPGERCSEALSCRTDLVCAGDERCRAIGAPGTAGVGEPCDAPAECRLGLVCGGAACLQPVDWAWPDCPEEDPEPVAYFRLPRGETLPDFYHLPFPSDLRLHGGRLDLRSHPDPGSALPVGTGGAARAAQGAEQHVGVKPLSVITFRLSAPIDWTTVRMEGSDPTVVLLLLDPAGVEPPRRRHFSWRQDPAAGPYHCGPTLALRPGVGWPLRPGGQAAALLLDGLRDRTGRPYQRESDLEALLSDELPEEDALSAAHATYGPLRAALVASEIDPERVLTATLFTVEDSLAALGRLADAAHHAPAPEVVEVHPCEEAPADWPCRSLGPLATPACPSPAAGYTELLGLLRVPSFRPGAPPYVDPGSGGVALRSDAPLLPLGTEEACFSLALPQGHASPPDGWPVVMYAHDRGGHARSAVVAGVAQHLAGPPGDGEDATLPRLAVLSVDAPGHGVRQAGRSPSAPRLADPVALRGERLQWVADQLLVERALGSVTLASPGGAPKLDGTRSAFVGLGDGAAAGVLFLAHAPRVRAGALLGGGADWALELTETPASAGLAAVLLATPPGTLHVFHPALALLQQYLDPVDPASVASHVMVRRREDDIVRKHLFGLATVDPALGLAGAQVALPRCLGLQQATPALWQVEGLDPVELPASRNIADYMTAVLELFEARDADPGAALLADARALRKLRHFLGSALAEPAVAPTVPR